MDALSSEEEARLAAERLQSSLKGDLEKAEREQESANQKVRWTLDRREIAVESAILCKDFWLITFLCFILQIASLNDMYKRLQEYNTSLQHYNTKLQTELAEANDALKRVEREKASVVEELSTVKGQNISLHEQLASSKVSSLLSLLFS